MAVREAGEAAMRSRWDQGFVFQTNSSVMYVPSVSHAGMMEVLIRKSRIPAWRKNICKNEDCKFHVSGPPPGKSAVFPMSMLLDAAVSFNLSDLSNAAAIGQSVVFNI